MGVWPFEELEKWKQEERVRNHPADLVFYPNEVLKRPAIEVPAEFPTDQLKFFSAVMVDRMLRYRGVGLAAPQLALPFRWCVIDKSGKGKDVKVLINPTARGIAVVGSMTSSVSPDIHSSSALPSVEGCLSCPGFQTSISRSKTVQVSALDENREPVSYEFEGQEAIIFQHELDHLNGLCIVDRSSRLQKIHYLSLLR